MKINICKVQERADNNAVLPRVKYEILWDDFREADVRSTALRAVPYCKAR